MLITIVDVLFALTGLAVVVAAFRRRRVVPKVEPAPPFGWAELILTGAALSVAAVGPNVLVVALTPGMPEMHLLGRWALLPSLALLSLVWVLSYVLHLPRLSNRVWVGVFAGASTTAVLDVVRLTGFSVGLMPGNMPRMFGVLLLDQMAVGPSVTSDLIGYLYHYWVGACFGLTYTLALGRTRWWGAAIWGLLVEIGMMVTPPMVVAMDTGYFGLKHGPGLLIVSLAAHVAFGIALGLLIERYVHSRGDLLRLAWNLVTRSRSRGFRAPQSTSLQR